MLNPAMPSHGEPSGPDARWVGLVDLADLDPSDVLALAGADGYQVARLLIRDAGVVRGYVSLPIRDGAVDADRLRTAAAALPTPEPAPEPTVLPPMSVVVCTRERPAMLREALASLVALDHPDFEVIVVDNAPVTTGTAEVAAQFGVRYVVAPVAGLSRARNRGLAAATHDIVAFTDDDVVVDAQWLRGLAGGFARGGDIACVSGLVPSGELRNSVQAYFDARVSWSKVLTARQFRLGCPPADLPMFPFCVGEFGTGANFAVRRDAVRALGGFDEALGVGTRTKGGEDLDIFTRLLFAGHGLAIEPAALVWHRHRDDLQALRAQAIGYGRGLGAWLTKVATRPRPLGMALARAPQALHRLVHKPMTTVEEPGAADEVPRSGDDPLAAEIERIGRLELFQVLVGPGCYLAERMRHPSGRDRRPVAA
mgnify:FL=1